MKKVSLLGISAILGMMALGDDANASIVSRGFLDNVLTDYVKTTALDLKANQSDLTDLSNKIGTLPTTVTSEYFFGDYTLPDNIGEQLRIVFYGNDERVNYIPGLIELFEMKDEIWNTLYYGLDGEWRGLTEMDTNIKNNTAKIGTLPEGITVQGMYEGWMSPSGIHTVGLSQVELDSVLVYNPRTDSAQNVEGLKGGLLHILNTMMSYGDYSPTDDEQGLAPFWKLTQSAYKTDELSTKIGTLPTGELPRMPFWTDAVLPAVSSNLGIEPNYPTSLAGLMELLFGKNDAPGILQLLCRGVTVDTDGDGFLDTNIGISLNYYLATSANETANAAKSTADANTAKIGTLPTGNMPEAPVWSDKLLPNNGLEPIYPTSLAGLMELLFGNSQKSSMGILQQMVAGILVDDRNGNSNSIGLYPNYLHATEAKELATTANTTANTANETANAAKSAADANTAKIGTLPTEYATVGEALTAIKGIAEDAKAAALAAIPDPKKEGATGKYVLTVDIIGDNATYHWEKINRSATESSTTE